MTLGEACKQALRIFSKVDVNETLARHLRKCAVREQAVVLAEVSTWEVERARPYREVLDLLGEAGVHRVTMVCCEEDGLYWEVVYQPSLTAARREARAKAKQHPDAEVCVQRWDPASMAWTNLETYGKDRCHANDDTQ